MLETYNKILKFEKINENKLNDAINQMYNTIKGDYLKEKLTLIGAYYKLNGLEETFYKMLDKTNYIIGEEETYIIARNQIGVYVNPNSNGDFLWGFTNVDYDNKRYDEIIRYIVCGSIHKGKKIPEIKFFSNLIHETNHSMSSFKNNTFFINNKMFSKLGYMISEYPEGKYINMIFNEFYNEYFTDLITNQIIKFKDYNIKNNVIHSYLKQFPNELYISNGYLQTKKICHMIFRNEELNEIVKKTYYNANLLPIIDYFKSKNVDFIEYSKKMDNLYKLPFIIKSDEEYLKEKSLILTK
ncbi:MAG: hypothetical protein MR411_00185 [Tenericutes bacterium]|nr:hypothetical protein [Mycoplasmatota bacterium]